jgi:hypothetical protein
LDGPEHSCLWLRLQAESEFSIYPCFSSAKVSQTNRFREIVLALCQSIVTAIVLVQSDAKATLADVYNACIQIHRSIADADLPHGVATSRGEMMEDEQDAFQDREDVIALLYRRMDWFLHPIHVLAYVLHQGFAQESTVPAATVRALLKDVVVRADGTVDASLKSAIVNEYGIYLAMFDDDDLFNEQQKSQHPFTWWQSWGGDMPVLQELALKLFSCPATGAAAERNWSTQDHIVTPKRARLLTIKVQKLIAVFENLRNLKTVKTRSRKVMGVSARALQNFRTRSSTHGTFKHFTPGPSVFMSEDPATDTCHSGQQMYESDSEGEAENNTQSGSSSDEDDSDDDEELQLDHEDFKAPDEIDVQPKPASVPRDLNSGQKVAVYFADDWDVWAVGTITYVNKRRNQSDNVTVDFPNWGECNLTFTCDNYGISNMWVVLDWAEVYECEDGASETSRDKTVEDMIRLIKEMPMNPSIVDDSDYELDA